MWGVADDARLEAVGVAGLGQKLLCLFRIEAVHLLDDIRPLLRLNIEIRELRYIHYREIVHISTTPVELLSDGLVVNRHEQRVPHANVIERQFWLVNTPHKRRWRSIGVLHVLQFRVGLYQAIRILPRYPG